jgi:ABC-type transport system involved in cytochrome bd biosynthesis fused ATPase/permease subunit
MKLKNIINSYFKKNISMESIEYKEDSLRNFSFTSFEMANLNFSLDKKKNDYIFKDLSFNFKKGDKIYIQGQSGIGKTILLEIISCLRTIDKEIIQNNKKNDFYKEFAFKTALLSPSISILEGSIAQNVAFGDDNINHYKVKKALEKVELKEFLRDDFYNNFILRRDIENISEGQKKKLALARAFYYDKEIFLLDELTSNLDLETEKEIVNLLVSNKEITIIVTSHTM